MKKNCCSGGMDELFRVRLVTNLDCNFSCPFCYQEDKRSVKVDPQLVHSILAELSRRFDRCSIMGGESTLYPDDLIKHVEVVSKFCNSVCLITNGSLLSEELLARLIKSGLAELTISIPSLARFDEITGHKLSVVMDNLYTSKRLLKNVRVNLVHSRYNTDEIESVALELLDRGFYVVICDDMTYPLEVNFGSFVSCDDFGFSVYEVNGNEFGVSKHNGKYDKTDLIITPVGTFVSWEGYLESIAKRRN